MKVKQFLTHVAPMIESHKRMQINLPNVQFIVDIQIDHSHFVGKFSRNDVSMLHFDYEICRPFQDINITVNKENFPILTSFEIHSWKLYRKDDFELILEIDCCRHPEE